MSNTRNTEKLKIDSKKSRSSVFERLGKKTGESFSVCKRWKNTGTCPYGSLCKYVSSHFLISPSKQRALIEQESKKRDLNSEGWKISGESISDCKLDSMKKDMKKQKSSKQRSESSSSSSSSESSSSSSGSSSENTSSSDKTKSQKQKPKSSKLKEVKGRSPTKKKALKSGKMPNLTKKRHVSSSSESSEIEKKKISKNHRTNSRNRTQSVSPPRKEEKKRSIYEKPKGRRDGSPSFSKQSRLDRNSPLQQPRGRTNRRSQSPSVIHARVSKRHDAVCSPTRRRSISPAEKKRPYSPPQSPAADRAYGQRSRRSTPEYFHKSQPREGNKRRTSPDRRPASSRGHSREPPMEKKSEMWPRREFSPPRAYHRVSPEASNGTPIRGREVRSDKRYKEYDRDGGREILPPYEKDRGRYDRYEGDIHGDSRRNMPYRREQYSPGREQRPYKTNKEWNEYPSNRGRDEYPPNRNREEYPPRNRDEYPPRNREEFPPRNREDYQSRGREEYPTRNRDDYPPNRARDEYPPRYREEYPPRNREEYPPRNRDEYPTRNREEYIPRNRDEYPPRNREEYPPGRSREDYQPHRNKDWEKRLSQGGNRQWSADETHRRAVGNRNSKKTEDLSPASNSANVSAAASPATSVAASATSEKHVVEPILSPTEKCSEELPPLTELEPMSDNEDVDTSNRQVDVEDESEACLESSSAAALELIESDLSDISDEADDILNAEMEEPTTSQLQQTELKTDTLEEDEEQTVEDLLESMDFEEISDEELLDADEIKNDPLTVDWAELMRHTSTRKKEAADNIRRWDLKTVIPKMGILTEYCRADLDILKDIIIEPPKIENDEPEEEEEEEEKLLYVDEYLNSFDYRIPEEMLSADKEESLKYAISTIDEMLASEKYSNKAGTIDISTTEESAKIEETKINIEESVITEEIKDAVEEPSSADGDSESHKKGKIILFDSIPAIHKSLSKKIENRDNAYILTGKKGLTADTDRQFRKHLQFEPVFEESHYVNLKENCEDSISERLDNIYIPDVSNLMEIKEEKSKNREKIREYLAKNNFYVSNS